MALQTSDVDRLAPAHRRRLSDDLYSAHVMVELRVTGEGFPRVKPQAKEPKSGVLADVKAERVITND